MSSPALHLAAFLSGVSALLFETLWFRQAGLAFGNGLWASALVLSSFMAGLALGSGLGASLGPRIARPARVYAALELAIGASGVALVWLLPRLGELLAPVFLAVGETPWALGAMRLGVAFALLVAPALAMGATLPVLVRALGGADLDFGRVLARVYGWNTLGAVVGAASGELLWLPLAGVLGSGLVAAAFNAGAAALGLAVAGDVERRVARAPAAGRAHLAPAAWRMLGASFGAGSLVLALEVVWFRFLSLYLATTSLAFAVMLAVVLAGIGAGSLAAAAVLRARPQAHHAAAPLALLSGALVVACYAGFDAVLAVVGVRKSGRPGDVLALAAPLVLPVATLSGALFALLGKRLNDVLDAQVRSTGLLVLANTLGSMLGPLAAGFVLLPRLGMERSLFALAAGYGLVALLAAGPAPLRVAARRPGAWVAALAFLAALLAFPHGLMERSYLDVIERRLARRGEEVIALREGHLETIQYARREFLGETLWLRMVTDGYSMSATTLASKRYMELFAYLPAALHPRLERALLISFGVGTTARALANLDELREIRVVDISPEVLEMSDVVFPDPASHPLRDPRVVVHVEDGRHFLETSRARFDLITGEPPPPAYAGVVNLYTREYFRRMAERLAEGGLASYWLPVAQLREREARAIVAAFCGAFPTCSLWSGSPGDWILLGAREPLAPVGERSMTRLFAEPDVAADLAEIGIEGPAQLLALFLADAETLARWTRDTPPLVDDRPHRAPTPMATWRELPDEFASLLDARAAFERFRASAWVARLVPPALREGVEEAFRQQHLATRVLLRPQALRIDAAHQVLTQSRLETLPLWLLGSDVARQRAVDRALAKGRSGAEIDYELGLRALAARDYDRAAERLGRVGDASPLAAAARAREMLALCLAGRPEEARRALERLEAARPEAPGLQAWMREHCAAS